MHGHGEAWIIISNSFGFICKTYFKTSNSSFKGNDVSFFEDFIPLYVCRFVCLFGRRFN